MPPRHVVHGQRAFLGALAEVGDRLLDLGEAHAIRVAHDRDDQALGRGNGDRDVEIVVVDDLVAFDLRIDRRNVLRRERDGLHEEAHEAEADAVLLLEQILVFAARLDDRRHVDVVERRQQRGGVLRFLEAVGDRLAQARHLHALFVAFARLGLRYGLRRGRGRSARLLRRRSASLRLMDRPALLGLRRRKHVVLGQPAILAGAADLAWGRHGARAPRGGLRAKGSRYGLRLLRPALREHARLRATAESPAPAGSSSHRRLPSPGMRRRFFRELRRLQPRSHSRRCAR